QYPTYPERGGLLILRHAQFFSGKILRLRDARIDVVGELGLKQAPARKDRQRDHVGALGLRDQKRRHRHLGDVKFSELELAPEGLGRMGVGGDQFDSLSLYRSVHQRLDTLVERGDKT